MTNNKILKDLIEIVGAEYVSADIADLIPYERDDQFFLVPPHRPDYVVRPIDKFEIQKIIKLANKNKIPIIPLASGINRKGLCIAQEGGILLDLRRMQNIEILPDMMIARVEPGVNFAQLVVALNEFPELRCITPDAPATASVLANYMLRGIYATSTRYGIDHLLTMEICLPNGEFLDTGSGATPNSIGPYCGIVNGPDLTKLFQANPGTFGVVTQGRIRLYNMPEVIDAIIITYPDLESMIEPAKQFTLRDLVAGVWIWTFSEDALKIIMDLRSADEEWFAHMIYLEGNADDVERQKEEVLKIAEKYGGKELILPPDFKNEFILDHRYMRGDIRGWRKGNLYGHSFYGTLKNILKYYETGKRLCKKYGFSGYHFEALPVSPFHGELMYTDPCILWDAGNAEQVKKIKQLHQELRRELLKIGIYGFFRAFPGVVKSEELGIYGDIWRKIKKLIDPNNIMNPGKPPLT
ncbi:MAG: FAD-binding protein [Candidatus Lokiarchaeota archaeon]|nr:FAD-binding protein [Candidatus Lokiarchaeota archaeon]